jgi:hypothetical protein
VGTVDEKLLAVRRRRDAIRLGGDGMLDVIATANFLRELPSESEDDEVTRVRRTIETGMVVIYARPFVQSRMGTGPLKIAPGLGPDLRATHDQLLEFRRTAYAHTDETPARSIIDVHEDAADWHLHWIYLTASGLDSVAELARAHLAAWLEELESVDTQIARAENA